MQAQTFSRKIKGKPDQLSAHLHGDVPKVAEPKARVLFETTAEVLEGLVTAYSDDEQYLEHLEIA